MSAEHRKRNGRVTCAAALIFVSFAAGCGIPRNVVWLPDSSAILYTTDEGGVGLLDVAAAENQLVLSTSRANAMVPAVHPDGEKFAVVRVSPGASSDSIQVLVYDLLGREQPKSPITTWQAENSGVTGETLRRSAAIWNPDGRSLLFWFLSGPGDVLRYGKYDFGTGAFEEIRVTVPLVDLWHFGFSPIREDGGGHLAVRDLQDGLTNLFFVDGGGWEQRITPDPRLRAFENATRPRPGDPEMSLRLPITTRGWQQDMVEVVMGEGRVTVDTAAGTVTYRVDKELVRQRGPLIDEQVVGWVPVGTAGFAVHGRLINEDTTPAILLEIVDLATRRTKPLGEAVMNGQRFGPVMPSPDGTMVAVTYAGQFGAVYTSVVDEQGEIVATFQISGPGWRRTVVPVKPRTPKNATPSNVARTG